jgi:hypothetical protein
MTTKEALTKTCELLRTVGDMTNDPAAFTAIESQINVLDVVAETDFETEVDAALAVYGSIATLYHALDQLPEPVRSRLDRDNKSVFHDIGRWHSFIFRQPGYTSGRRDGRHVAQVLDEASERGRALSRAIKRLLADEPDMDHALRAAVSGWLHELSTAEAELHQRQGFAREDPEIFWAGQMVADACYRLAGVAWSAVVIFGYSATSRDPNAAAESRATLIRNGRQAGSFIDSEVGSWHG